MREDDSWELLDGCAAVLKTLAVSLLPFAAAPAQPIFKIVDSSSVDGERVISCDPAEVVDAHGFDMVAVELLREAMDGMAAGFGRREQARLVLLASGLLAEAAVLRRSGLSAWTLQSGLQQAVEMAEVAIRKVTFLQTNVEIQQSFTDPTGNDDDVSWFFTAAEEPSISLPTQTPSAAHKAVSNVDAVAAESMMDDMRTAVKGICFDLCGRHNGPESQHCFVYGRQKLVKHPRLSRCRGIACRVPKSHVAGHRMLCRQVDDQSGRETTEQALRFSRSVCLDADLFSATYDSCAPSQRRTKETVFQNAGASLLSTTEDQNQLLSQALHALSANGTETLLISGEVSRAAADMCQAAGLLLIAGIPARLLCALAADLGVEVLHGLPAMDENDGTSWPWQAKRALRVQLVEVNAFSGDFAFPLLGFRQPLLPHQNDRMANQEPLWEIWAAAEDGDPASSVVLLEGSCEPLLRQLHAELHDTFLAQLMQSGRGEVDHGWMLKAADALEETAMSSTLPALLAAKHPDPPLAPWLHQSGNITGVRAACGALASALRHVSAAEENYFTECVGEQDTSAPAETSSSALAVLKRGTRFVEVLLSLDEAQLCGCAQKQAIMHVMCWHPSSEQT